MRLRAQSVLCGGLLAVGALVGLACNAITGLNHYEIDPSLADAGDTDSGNGEAGAPCTTILDCPGIDDVCQTRACNENHCQTVLVSAGTAVASQTLGDCRRIECDGMGSSREVIDTDDVPNDGLECTTDACSPEGDPSNPFRMAGVKCTQDDGSFCNGMGACVACSFSTDCPGNGPCKDGKCVSPQCVDGNTNGNETDIDCGGGDCAPCNDMHSCLANADCISKVCIAKKCEPATCTDATENGDETDVDCGGPTCSDCLDGKGCLVASDCTSSVCTNNLCQAPQCNDGVKNGSETDLDCGSTCGGCAPGKACNVHADCQSEACLAGKCAGIVQIAAGTSHACALLSDGTVYCWGSNTNGELGDGTLVAKPNPQKVPSLLGATQLSLGINANDTQGAHSCARLMDGTAMCWGRNASGQLGIGTSVAATTPTKVKTITGVAQIVAGGRHSCARLMSGAVYCWGGNGQGQVGNGTTTGTPSPVAIAGILASSLALGDAHSCALLTSGTISCWGDGTLGEIGNGATADKAVPTAVPGLSNIVQMAAGKDFMLARSGAGSVYSWGENSDGQLGLGNTTMQTTPQEIPGLVGIVALAGGTDGVSTDADGANGGHSCVVFPDGTLQCFGHGLRGQLGTGGITNQATAQPVTIPPVAEVSLGLQFSCARLVSGAIRCWGRNDKGQLGTGAVGPDQTTPTAVVFP